jgi:hypothetical protein
MHDSVYCLCLDAEQKSQLAERTCILVMHPGTWRRPDISRILGGLTLSEILFTAHNNGQHKEPTAQLCIHKPEIPKGLTFFRHDSMKMTRTRSHTRDQLVWVSCIWYPHKYKLLESDQNYFQNLDKWNAIKQMTSFMLYQKMAQVLSTTASKAWEKSIMMTLGNRHLLAS